MLLAICLTCLCGFRNMQAAPQAYDVEQESGAGQAPDSPKAEARLRINNDGLMFYIYAHTACAPRWARGGASYSPQMNRSVKQILLFQKPKPNSAGIPQRASKMPVTYNEYRIPAGVPITVATGFYEDTSVTGRSPVPSSSRLTTCGPVFSMFVPENGKDYELESPQQQDICAAVISELDGAGEKTALPVKVAAVGLCQQDNAKLVPIPFGED
ncbi:hypothetical protein [Xanthomonas bonasiae]|uniref:hypothetical protein n=1 Tax=Xanthomonas bonasiae TaxID=2810351 RepID=UPI00197FDCD1|nr:hypothetical protein [Xanthomonas bonasiae]MBN6112413.1 hypothetical protein [Xanthomonas bonasiae]